MITTDQLRKMCPGARPDIAKHVVDHAGSVLPRYGITTPLRIAHFMAQIAHESGGLTIDWEKMHYSPERIKAIFGKGKHSSAVTDEEAAKLAGDEQALAERVYGCRTKIGRNLGNKEPGDGYKYRGYGLIQITGRDNHERYAEKIGAPLAEHLLEVAAAFWLDRGCNELADLNDLRALTKRINGGFNGLADREAKFKRAWGIWGGEDSAPGERSLATRRDVEKAGSTIEKRAKSQEVGGLATASAGAGAVAIAPPVDPVAEASKAMEQIASTRQVVEQGHDTLLWIIGHWPIAVIVLGLWMWRTGRLQGLSRLKNFRTNQA